MPGEMRAVGTNLGVLRGWLWWRRIALPAVFPFYVTGALTASGGSWNAAIVGEVASMGQRACRGRRARSLHRQRDRGRRLPCKIALGVVDHERVRGL